MLMPSWAHTILTRKWKIRMSSMWLQSSRFVLVGSANTLTGLTIIFAAKGFAGLNDFESNLLGYSFGLLISFFLNRRWTFRHNGRIFPTAIRFAIAFLFSYIANLLTVYGLRDSAGLNSYLAQTISIIPYTIIFYLSSRYYVFPEKDVELAKR
jgi:putative flippase GtrA